jgi:enoyl-CoA hydratase/carnithine racemase
MEFETVLYSVDAGVALITLNRPEALNAWTPQLSDELWLALGAADTDDNVRAVVITGAGRAFCAGADLSGGEDGFKGGKPSERPGPRLMPFQVRKPVIAAINGHAVGVGITMALLCDIRIASENAKIQFAMVRRGVIPELGSSNLLPRIVGMSRAAELLLTGRLVTGKEAAEMTLVSRAVPTEDVLPAALEMARDIAVNVAPVSAAVAKRIMWDGIDQSVVETMDVEHRTLPALIAQADAVEGVKAFFEKRDPVWTSRVSTHMPSFK